MRKQTNSQNFTFLDKGINGCRWIQIDFSRRDLCVLKISVAGIEGKQPRMENMVKIIVYRK